MNEDEFRANGYTTQEYDSETGTLETVDDDEESYVDEEPVEEIAYDTEE